MREHGTGTTAPAGGLFHADRYGHSAFSFLTGAANLSPYRRSKPRRPPAIQWPRLPAHWIGGSGSFPVTNPGSSTFAALGIIRGLCQLAKQFKERGRLTDEQPVGSERLDGPHRRTHCLCWANDRT
jgi:hypothetical protein